jgi:predicted DsbA family dithiol-disulfide isomerase
VANIDLFVDFFCQFCKHFWDRCYDFLNIFANKQLVFQQIDQNTLVIEKNANFFAQKYAKIAENCDHNVDPLVTLLHVFHKT